MSTLHPSTLSAHIGKPLAQAFPEWEEIRGELVKVQPHLFAILDDTDDANASGEMPIHGLLWAASTGAALRAWFSEIEADETTTPSVVSSASNFEGSTYSAVLSELKGSGRPYIESASYRIMSDGKFIHKSIQTKGRMYFFRSQNIDDLEPAYAVLHTHA